MKPITREMVRLAVHSLKARWETPTGCRSFSTAHIAEEVARMFGEDFAERKQKDGRLDSVYDTVCKHLPSLREDRVLTTVKGALDGQKVL